MTDTLLFESAALAAAVTPPGNGFVERIEYSARKRPPKNRVMRQSEMVDSTSLYRAAQFDRNGSAVADSEPCASAVIGQTVVHTQHGNLSAVGIFSNASSQQALLDTNIWEFGLMRTWLFRLPAGTTSNRPSICIMGSADPHVLQKHLLCRVAGKLNCLTLSSPETQFSAAVDENRLAA